MRSIWLSSCLLALLAALPASAQQTGSPAAADQTAQASAPDQATQPGQTTQASAAPAADPAPAAQATTPPPAPASPPVWSLGPIDFSGAIDGYYSFNFNHPRFFESGNGGEQNILYNFNIPTNQFSLSFLKLGMSHTADPVGFEFDLAYGDTMKQIDSVSNPPGNFFDNIVEQAYVSFKPTKAKGFEADFGKFVTSAGAEVIESYTNWNYSHSLLFAWAIPYYHLGLRTSWPVGKHATAGFQVVNSSWNNSVAINTAATLGANLMLTYPKWNWMLDWYGGPGNAGINKGWKNLFDTTVNLTASAKWAAYINYDYGEIRLWNPGCGAAGSLCPLNGFGQNQYVDWQGVAGALHIMPTSKWSVTGRYEFFDDPQGFAMLGANPYVNTSAAVSKNVQEFTGTVEYKFLEGLMWRGEYRYDWSDKPFFQVGGGTDAEFALGGPASFGLGNSKHQNTLTFAIIAFFGPKR